MEDNRFADRSMPLKMAPWIIGVTGASGSIYARRLIEAMISVEPTLELHIVFSEAALRVLREEEKIATSIHSIKIESVIGFPCDRVHLHNNRDIGASFASGSYPTAGMVIVPCSMSTLAAVAHGFGQNLIHRAADVTIKEGRRLVIVPRETPLSVIHLENMLTLARLGVRVVPAMPGFYHQPNSITEIVDMMVMRILDQMGITINLTARWKINPMEQQTWPVHGVEDQNAKKGLG